MAGADLWWMLGTYLLTFPVIWRGMEVTRWEGGHLIEDIFNSGALADGGRAGKVEHARRRCSRSRGRTGTPSSPPGTRGRSWRPGWEAHTELEGVVVRVIRIPRTHDALTPILAIVPLQLLAYHMP